MNKKQIIDSMQKHCGEANLISQTEFMEWAGFKSRTSTVNLLRGLTRFHKKYFIPEVAERVLGECR